MISEHFASFLIKQHPKKHEAIEPLVRQLSDAVQAGSSCIDLENDTQIPQLDIPTWKKLLLVGDSASIAGSETDYTPLVITKHNLLYMRRYFDHEMTVAKQLQRHIQANSTPIKPSAENLLNILFPPSRKADFEDLQKKAAITALKQRLTIISGGPGTGKTTTVVKILALLKVEGIYENTEEVLMLAPTGKAADRLSQSIIKGHEEILQQAPEYNLELVNLPHETSTIHRALGYIPRSIEFKHNAQNPLPHKVVIIDESSMIDLPLMARLLSAISEKAHIILLGDKHQLSSVQVGTVLADLSKAAENVFNPLHNCTVTLTHTYRNSGAIKDTCDAIRDGNAPLAYRRIRKKITDDCIGTTELLDIPKEAESAIQLYVERYWLPVILNKNLDIEEKLEAVDRFKILCPSNRTYLGVDHINQMVDKILAKHGIQTQSEWYEGRAIIIQQNDHDLSIYNGDIGYVTTDKNAKLVAVFKTADAVRVIPCSQLPACKTAWALTIHKTQGSEYENILIILNEQQKESDFLTRELLYTAISRAKSHVTVWASKTNFQEAIEKTVSRASGLVYQFET